MNLYLTGADNSLIESGNNSPQNNPDNSLGGYVSSTLAPSGNLNEMFDLITNFAEEDKTETFCFCLKNNLTDVTDVKATILTTNRNIGKFKVGVSDIDEILYTEKISNKYHIPQSVVFVEANLYKAFVDVEIVTLGSIGEEFTIMPFDVLGEIKEFSYDGVFDALAKGFKESGGLYSVKRLNEKNLRIERVDETVESFECELITTDGLDLRFSKTFGNEVNQELVIDADFKADEMKAIWIQRTVEKQTLSDLQVLNNYDNKTVSEKLEEIELIISYNTQP